MSFLPTGLKSKCMNVEKLVLEEEYKNNGNSGMDRVVVAKF